MKKAFTLAEVLITLGIIGIVAAMTLPTVLSSYKKKEVPVRLKKFSSTIQNALNLATTDYGEIRYWNFGDFNYLNSPEQIDNFVMTYLAPYLSELKSFSSNSPSALRYITLLYPEGYSNRMPVFIFKDGGCFGVIFGGIDEDLKAGNIQFRYDYNCLAKPNEPNKDQFSFIIRWENDVAGSNKVSRFKAGNYDTISLKTREELLQYCIDNVDTLGTCTGLIEMDGWEIKKDYPW